MEDLNVIVIRKKLQYGCGESLLVLYVGNPLPRYQFASILAKTLKFCNINNGQFRSHSFRIGAATEAAMRGIPDVVIKQWGRWKSGAYTSYIRL